MYFPYPDEHLRDLLAVNTYCATCHSTIQIDLVCDVEATAHERERYAYVQRMLHVHNFIVTCHGCRLRATQRFVIDYYGMDFNIGGLRERLRETLRELDCVAERQMARVRAVSFRRALQDISLHRHFWMSYDTDTVRCDITWTGETIDMRIWQEQNLSRYAFPETSGVVGSDALELMLPEAFHLDIRHNWLPTYMPGRILDLRKYRF